MDAQILPTLSIESGWEGRLVSAFLIPWRWVHEMTMNDHEGEGEGSRNDHVVRLSEIFCAMYCVR